MEGSDRGRQWTPGFCGFNYCGKNLDWRYLIELIMLNPKIQTAPQSDHFPRRYGCFSNWSGLKLSGTSYLDLGISLSPEGQRHTRMSCLEQYQGMERNGKFYRTLVLDRVKQVDSKYSNVTLVT